MEMMSCYVHWPLGQVIKMLCIIVIESWQLLDEMLEIVSLQGLLC